MMPLGISSAAAVRVGMRIGRGDRERRVASGWTALALGASVMSVAAVAAADGFRVRSRVCSRRMRRSSRRRVPLLRVAAFFQLFDGLQIVATGLAARRGRYAHADAVPFRWVLDIGLAAGRDSCVFTNRWARVGLWMGLSAGLIVIGSWC